MTVRQEPVHIEPDPVGEEERYRVSGAPLRGDDWWFELDAEGNSSIQIAPLSGPSEEPLVIDLAPSEEATRARIRQSDLLTLAYWLRAAAVEYLSGYALEEIPASEWQALTQGLEGS